MSDSSQHPLFAASHRLVAALDRLERNLQELSVARDRDVLQQQQLSQFTRENESLRAERETLNLVIERLNSQYNDLQKVATNIHGKLDDSVKRISQILEG